SPATPLGLVLYPLVDLNVPPDQGAGAGRVGRGLDAKGVHGPWLAAVVDIDRERLGGRAGRPDHRRRAGELGVLASGRRGARSAGTADEEAVDRPGLDPHVLRVVVVLQVSARRAALHREPERSV